MRLAEHDLLGQQVLDPALAGDQMARGGGQDGAAQVVVLRQRRRVHHRQEAVQPQGGMRADRLEKRPRMGAARGFDQDMGGVPLRGHLVHGADERLQPLRAADAAGRDGGKARGAARDHLAGVEDRAIDVEFVYRLTMTLGRTPGMLRACASRLCMSVAFPAPRNPFRIVTGACGMVLP